MRFPRLVSFGLALLSISAPLPAQQSSPPQRDPQAMAILQQSLAAMGGSVPADVVATGSVAIVAGSTNENGSVRVLVRGTDQSSEQVTTASGTYYMTRSRGRAAEQVNGAAKQLPLELVVTSHTGLFPLLLVGRALADTTTQVQYVGLEVVAGGQFHHIRIADTFADPRLAHLTDFSKRDLWIDTASLLPSKLLHERRASRGPTYPIRVEISFSRYRSAAGILYPSLVQRSLNGTPYQTFLLDGLAVNTGLTDADFSPP